MGMAQLEKILQRDDVPFDVKELVIGHLDEIKGNKEALQESEERLRDFMESATDIIQLFDSNLNYLSVNKAAEKMLNLSREEIIGKSYLDFFPYLKGTDRLNEYKDVIKTGKHFVREGPVPKFSGKSFLIRAFKVGNGLGMIISDVTERKKTEEALIDGKQALLDSNKKLLKVQHLAKMGFLDWNLKTDRILLSDKVIHLYGLDPEKKWFTPDLVAKVVHQDDMNYVQSNLEMAIKGIKKYSIDHRVVRPDGTVFWVQTEAELAHDKEGNPQNLLGTIVDITERKEMEEALRESEERLRSFMEASPDNFLLFDENLDLIEANAATIASYPSVTKREDIIGKNLLEMSPDVKETGRYEQYQKVLRTGEPISVEEFIPHPKFGEMIISLKAFKVGKGLGLIATDITERKRAEEDLRRSEIRYRKLFEESPVSLWEEDFSQVFSYLASLKESGIEDFRKYFTEHPECVSKCASMVKILDVNQATLDLYKAKSKDEIIENLNRVFVEESYDTFRKELIALAEGATKFSTETTGQNLKGEEIYVDLGLSISTGFDNPSSRVLISILDVTKRKRAEDSLRKSEEKLRAFMDAATDNFTLFDSKLEFIDMNSYAQRELNELGIDLNKVIGMNLLDFNPASKETGTYDKFLEVIRTGEPFNGDDMVPDPKFGNKYYTVKAFKVGDGLGVIATDVTKDKQMEELMRVQRDLGIALSSTSNLKEALDYILDATIKIKEIDSGGIYLIDQNTGALYLTCHMGLSDSFLATVNPIRANDPRYNLVMKGEPIYAPFDQVAPSQVDRTQLEERLLSLGVIPVLFEEKVVAVLNVASHTHSEISDNTRNSLEAITNQISSVLARLRAEEASRESEHRFRTIFNNATDGILLADQESNKLYTCNDMMCQTLGFSLEELKNLGVLDIHPKEDQTYVIDQFEKQSRGEITLARDIPVKRKDGSIFYADVNSSHVILSGKTYLMGIFRDITEQKRAEKTKEDLEKKRAAFISMTSHELRTPITVIKGYSEFLNKNIEKIDYIRKSQAIQSILGNVLRLERLIEGVADITRMEQGIFELNTSICDFSKFLEKSTQPYEELYGEKFSLYGTHEFESPVFLNIDIDRIRQVLDNLMNNANKNTPEHGTIVLTPTVLSNTIQIAISDTGVGIGSNDLERIFEQFVSITTEQASGGTGIGLYVSRVICESHEGTLTAHSEGKNQGATFIIELPRWIE